jgi:hypothetical protein
VLADGRACVDARASGSFCMKETYYMTKEPYYMTKETYYLWQMAEPVLMPARQDHSA